jgi:hypothetical protein
LLLPRCIPARPLRDPPLKPPRVFPWALLAASKCGAEAVGLAITSVNLTNFYAFILPFFELRKKSKHAKLQEKPTENW